MKGVLRSLIYEPNINRLLRGVIRLFGSLVPDKFKINPSGSVKIPVNSEIELKLKTNQTSYVTRQLYWNDPLNFEYTAIFLHLIRKVGTFWDVGANIGYYSILGSKTNQNLIVQAFEPSMGPQVYLSENSKINKVSSRVHVHRFALSDKTEDIDFYQVFNAKFPKILNLSGEHNTGAKKDISVKKIRVSAKRINEVRRETQAIDLLKIDVEGAEIEVLRGGFETIKEDRPIVICEVLYGLNESDLQSLFKGLDYSFFAHVENGLKRMASIIRKEDNGIRDVFFVPVEKENLVAEFIVQ